MTEPLAVLFEDAHILAVDKPPGLLTQGKPSGEPTLELAVRRYLSPDEPGSVYVGTVHRLDRPVSGVVVWAKTPRAARRLSAQFAAHEAVKEYWAVVEALDRPAATEGVWENWLTRSSDESGVVHLAPPGSPGSRRAVTRYRETPGARVPDGMLWLVLWPETGRTHQIRAQAALNGLPVWGDRVYGSTRDFPVGIALHARSLTITHPASRDRLTLTSQVPATWTSQGIEPPGPAAPENPSPARGGRRP